MTWQDACFLVLMICPVVMFYVAHKQRRMIAEGEELLMDMLERIRIQKSEMGAMEACLEEAVVKIKALEELNSSLASQLADKKWGK